MQVCRMRGTLRRRNELRISLTEASPSHAMMVQFPVLLAVAVLAALIGTFPAAGQTNVCRPWCVIYTGGVLGGATNCGFTSYQQCTWTAQGLKILRAERRLPTGKL
jgi:hypothetical protein